MSLRQRKKEKAARRERERRFRFPRRDSAHIERWVDSHRRATALLHSH